jgi:hypothetical protein
MGSSMKMPFRFLFAYFWLKDIVSLQAISFYEKPRDQLIVQNIRKTCSAKCSNLIFEPTPES